MCQRPDLAPARRERQARYRERHREALRERSRARWQDPAVQDADRARQRSEAQRLKRQARAAVRQAERSGTLTRPLWCEVCRTYPGTDSRGRSLLRADHHRGYDPAHWLDVRWICAVCDQRAEGRARRKE